MNSAVDLGSTVTIGPRFRGPDDSGNGGYVCGLAATFLEGPAEVTLRTPPPLNHPLAVHHLDDGSIRFQDGDVLVAEARSTEAQSEAPPPVSWETATRVAMKPSALDEHVFPDCFVCGPARPDGLRIFPGDAGDGLLAGPWSPGPDLADDEGKVAPEFVWSALDCPSGWATIPLAGPGTVAVLGRLTAVIHERPTVGTGCVVVADSEGRSGRKLFGRSALYTDSGRLLAAAKAIWIIVTLPSG